MDKEEKGEREKEKGLERIGIYGKIKDEKSPPIKCRFHEQKQP